jgi:hypothetical protein
MFIQHIKLRITDSAQFRENKLITQLYCDFHVNLISVCLSKMIVLKNNGKINYATISHITILRERQHISESFENISVNKG